jgi:hypothetical protein
MHVGSGGTGTMIGLDWTRTTTTTTKGADDHDEEDPPQGGKIRKEGQGEEEGLASVVEILYHAAVQVEDSNMVFLLMAEAMVVTATASLSTVASGASASLGAGMMTIIPGLSLLRRCPGQRQ